MSKKQTTTKTAKTATSKPKYYVAILEDEEIIAQGTWDDIGMVLRWLLSRIGL